MFGPISPAFFPSSSQCRWSWNWARPAGAICGVNWVLLVMTSDVHIFVHESSQGTTIMIMKCRCEELQVPFRNAHTYYLIISFVKFRSMTGVAVNHIINLFRLLFPLRSSFFKMKTCLAGLPAVIGTSPYPLGTAGSTLEGDDATMPLFRANTDCCAMSYSSKCIPALTLRRLRRMPDPNMPHRA